MIGRTLFTYFLRRYLVIAMQFFLGLLILTYLIDFAELVRRVSGLPGYSIFLAMAISALRIPVIVQQTLPFVILFAAMSTLMLLNRKYELVVARSAGVSAWQFLLPLCVGSLLIGLVGVTVFNTFAARALTYSEEIESQFRGGVRASDRGRLPWLKQRTEEGATIVGAKSTARRGLLLNDATFLRFDKQGTINERLDARSAVLGAGAWELTDVVRIDSDGNRSTLATARVASDLKPEFVEEQFARPESIPLLELREKIAAAQSFGMSSYPFAMQYHSLLALPWLLVAMTLIAATVSMRFARLGQSAAMILGGILAGFLLYVLSELVKAFGSAGVMPPVVAAWIPVVLATFFGVTFLLHKEDG
ncbi:MAG: LPS export ABC transporter permease LptG [Mesorhizobium sp.]